MTSAPSSAACRTSRTMPSGSPAPAPRLQQVRLAGGELDRVRRGVGQHVDGPCEVLDAREERELAEEAVVDGDVQAAPGASVEQAVEPEGGRHGGDSILAAVE